MILNAHEANGCNVSEAAYDSILSIINVRLSVLTSGNYFDIVLKNAFNPGGILV